MSRTQPPGKTRTRREILTRLKLDGSSDTAQLAERLGVGRMAVRQHLYDLQEHGLVTFDQAPSAVGRPAKLWRLTAAADDQFPDNHADLTLDLIHAMTRTFGADGMDKLLETRMHEQIARYRAQIDTHAALQTRLRALARLRTAEGYMADVQSAGSGHGGDLLLVENHCPICAAAKTCAGLCQRELETFQAVLGDGVRVERVEHILAGARRCAYRVTPDAIP